MDILHSLPAGVAWFGPTFLTSPDALTDSKPARTCRIEWPTDSPPSPVITDKISLVGQWPVSSPVGGMQVIFQRRVPAGVRVTCLGRRVGDADYTYDLGGNSQTQRTIARPDGTVLIQFLFAAGIDPLIGILIEIFDDADGATFAEDYIEIGEIFFGERESWCISSTLGSRPDDPTLHKATLGNQPHVVQRKAADVINVEISPVSFDDAYTAARSLERLKARLIGMRDCVMIFTERQPHSGTGPVDYEIVQAVAMFGKCTAVGELKTVETGQLWALPLTFRQSPGRLTP